MIDYKISSLPVSLSSLCSSAGIKILEDSVANELKIGEFGIAIRQNEQWFIIYDDADTLQRARFTIAHELGHIFLGHDLKNGFYTRKYNLVKPSDETEADMFAIRLLAPACVLWGINAHTPTDIAEICNISLTSAKIRAERLDLLRRRNKFLTSKLEQQVYSQFSEYIKNNQHY